MFIWLHLITNKDMYRSSLLAQLKTAERRRVTHR